MMFAIWILNHQNKIPIVFHNGSTYEYHFMITELAKWLKGEFKRFGKNTEKYITFAVWIKNQKGQKHEIKFIDSFRFMSSSLSSRVDNLPDGLIMTNVSLRKKWSFPLRISPVNVTKSAVS